MARYPQGVWRPLSPENSTQPNIVPTQAIVHSAAVDVRSLYDYFANRGVNVESHAFAKFDGTVEQYIDTSRSADANYLVNRRWDGTKFVGALSLETEDRGDPNTRPWTEQQIAGIIGWFEWAITVHGIPRRVCRSWSDPGIGYHVQFSQWSKYAGKTCPGIVRVRQWNDIVVPHLLQQQTYTSAAVPKERFVLDSRGLTALDPATGGVWCGQPDGSVYTNLGAPYLGGYNAWPEWGAGVSPRRLIALLAKEDVDGGTGWGYLQVFDDGATYFLTRDGRYVR